MSQSLVVNSKTFLYPSPGDEPGWGEDATAWAAEVTAVLTSLLAPGDIIETTFSVPSGASSGDVSGLLFNNSVCQSAVAEYYIYRRSDENPTGKIQQGLLYLVYDNDALTGSKWTLSHQSQGDAGVTFDITDLGQITYVSTTIGTTSYVGLMKFKAKTLTSIS